MKIKPYIFLLLVSLVTHATAQEAYKPEVYQSPLSTAISFIVLSSDGEQLVASDTSGYVFFWARDGSLRKIVRAHVQQLSQLAISTDGRFLATSSADAQVNVMDFNEGETLSSFSAGQDLLTLSFAGNFVLFARKDGVYRAPVRGGEKPERIYSASISAAGKSDEYFVVADENGLTLFGNTDSRQRKAQPCYPVQQLECRGKSVAVLCSDGTLEFFEITGLGLEKKSVVKVNSANAKIMITDDKKVLVINAEGSLLWNPSSGKIKKHEELPMGTTAIGYGKNGILYAGDSSGRISSFRLSDSESQKVPAAKAVSKAETGMEVKMSAGGVPKSFNGRPVQAGNPVEVSAASFDIFVWDNEREDGDTISLSLNGKWLLENYMITTEKKQVTVTLTPGSANYLVLYAHNLGKFPPNTAVISFHDGTAEKKLTLESDLRKCGAVSFILKK